MLPDFVEHFTANGDTDECAKVLISDKPRNGISMTHAKLTIEYVKPNLPPTSLALEICPMQAGARLRNDPEANPKMTENI